MSGRSSGRSGGPSSSTARRWAHGWAGGWAGSRAGRWVGRWVGSSAGDWVGGVRAGRLGGPPLGRWSLVPGGATPGFAAPRVEVQLGAWLPGAVVRLAPAALVALVGELVRAGPLAGLLLTALAVVLVVRPALPAVAGVVLVAGLALFGGPDLLAPPGTTGGVSVGAGGAEPPGPLGPLRLGLLVLVLDAAVRAAALAPHVAWSGRVEWSVLARLGRAVLRTQVLVQPVLWLAYGVRAVAPGPAGGEPLRLVALVSVGVLLALLVPRRRRPGGPWP